MQEVDNNWFEAFRSLIFPQKDIENFSTSLQVNFVIYAWVVKECVELVFKRIFAKYFQSWFNSWPFNSKGFAVWIWKTQNRRHQLKWGLSCQFFPKLYFLINQIHCIVYLFIKLRQRCFICISDTSFDTIYWEII